jgi:SpoVK/Ycf46/Vps4 family AAA+-type ATPase
MGPDDLIKKREKHQRKMELQALRRSERVPSSCRDAYLLRESIANLRAYAKRLWAEIEALELDCEHTEPVLVMRINARRKEIDKANRKCGRFQKYLAILEGKEHEDVGPL